MTNSISKSIIFKADTCGMILTEAFDKAHNTATLAELKIDGYHCNAANNPALERLLKLQPALQRLVFSECIFDQETSIKLIEVAGQYSYLKSLVFNQVRLTDESLVAIAGMIRHNRNIQQLSLQGNDFTITGVRVLANALLQNKCLLVLDLSHNQLTADCAVVLAEALAKNRMLEVLNLSHNQIGDKGAEAMAKLLTQNIYLEKLYLQENTISYSTVNAFYEAVDINKSIIKLSLYEKLFPTEDYGIINSLIDRVISNIYLAENRREDYIRLVIYIACAIPTSAFGQLPLDIMLHLFKFIHIGTTGKSFEQLFNCTHFLIENSEGAKQRIKRNMLPLVKESRQADNSQFTFFKPLNLPIGKTAQEEDQLEREAQLDAFIHSLSELRGKQTPARSNILLQEIKRINHMFNKNYKIYGVRQDDVQAIIDDLARMKQQPERHVRPKIAS